MELSVVVPAYNSEKSLPRLVEQLVPVAQSCAGTFEIILVNDCSADGTWDVITALADRHSCVKGLNLRRNAGQHNATMAGLNHATGRVAIIMDDDLQHSPSDVARLYAKISEGYDVCYARFGKVHHPLWKRLGSAFNDRMACMFLNKPSGLYLSSFKAISNGVRQEIVRYTGPFAYVDGLILMTTSSIATIDVVHHPRLEGRGNYNLTKSIMLWAKMATSFSVLPLRLAGVVGGLMAFAGFMAAAVAVWLRLFSSTPIPIGWTSLLVAVMITGGTQLIALWLIGEYLGRAYVCLNNVPQYSVKSAKNLIESDRE